jgi:hypothetical protein
LTDFCQYPTWPPFEFQFLSKFLNIQDNEEVTLYSLFQWRRSYIWLNVCLLQGDNWKNDDYLWFHPEINIFQNGRHFE